MLHYFLVHAHVQAAASFMTQVGLGAHFTCFTSTKVQKLTRRQALLYGTPYQQADDALRRTLIRFILVY